MNDRRKWNHKSPSGNCTKITGSRKSSSAQNEAIAGNATREFEYWYSYGSGLKIAIQRIRLCSS
jgi:hypothetical protein